MLGSEPFRSLIICTSCLASIICVVGRHSLADEEKFASEIGEFFSQYCLDCHSEVGAEANINLEKLGTDADFATNFRDAKKIIRVLRSHQMPPEEMPQPTDDLRFKSARLIENHLNRFAEEYSGDPGHVVMRHLTSSEYGYAIEDLTDLKLDFGNILTNDAVGGEGFTNVGTVQFVQDSTIERSLEAARLVASHAVIGAGPLQFFKDPGQSGLELSAIDRIQKIYRDHGFRSGAGEGGKPFGLDMYPKAFFVAWKHRHRDALGLTKLSLEQLSDEVNLSRRFARHVADVLSKTDHKFPLNLIVSDWKSLPIPTATNKISVKSVFTQCQEIAATVSDWQATLAAATGDEEEVAVLTATSVKVHPEHSFEARIEWKEGSALGTAELSVTSADSTVNRDTIVIWKNPRMLFRMSGRRTKEPTPLLSLLTPDSVQRLQPGQHPSGAQIGRSDFVIASGKTIPIAFRVPDEITSGKLLVDVILDQDKGRGRVVRCTISDGQIEGETVAEIGSTSILLADPVHSRFPSWKAGVVEFGTQFPQISHREPAPSDRDPIPAPFDNTYNTAERNKFHYVIKYHRDDGFLVQHILDDETRMRLDEAWVDLLTSYDYHDTFAQFVQEKFNLQSRERRISDWTPERIARLPSEPRQYIGKLYESYVASQRELSSAQAGHLADLLAFAKRAWRRPLSEDEKVRIQTFYHSLKKSGQLDHTAAVRTVIARILASPAFLYRMETNTPDDDLVPLSDLQLANRLSFFLWSSLPDDELLQLATSGSLQNPDTLEKQSRRMLRDPKAKRLATEFFGQWFGFYRFAKYQGVDRHRFPEFTDSLKASMESEANSFFEYIVRDDRPVHEILFADYSFLNRELAEHYQIEAPFEFSSSFQRMEGLNKHHRGGLLGMASVLTVTSAPLRTSPVKRGDWVLRRVLGTAVPPPPADAGSIAADDSRVEGLSIREQLIAHRRDASCINCHSRIDPPGFALENFDPLGRWRETYRDGQSIDAYADLGEGDEIKGPEGLRRYLQDQEEKFYRTLSAKLLGYGLGRSELLSDQDLLEKMTKHSQEDRRFSTLIVDIVTSTQFRYQRGNQAAVRFSKVAPTESPSQ